MVIINGRRTASTVDLARYKECIPSAAKARDITTGRTYNISAATQLSLTPRQTMILEYWYHRSLIPLSKYPRHSSPAPHGDILLWRGCVIRCRMPHGKEKGGAGGQMGDAILLHTTRYPSYHCKLLEFLTKEAITVHGLFYQLLSLLSGNYIRHQSTLSVFLRQNQRKWDKWFGCYNSFY